jgi:hypothetical protein
MIQARDKGLPYRTIVLRTAREIFSECEPCWLGKGVSPYRSGLYNFSHIFVLVVYRVFFKGGFLGFFST